MTTYTLTMTPADAPHTVKHGLSREEALWAITDLVYGTHFAGPQRDAAETEETREPIAA